MTDPYKVLGVTRDAKDEDIKKAYRTLARKYHPDNYAGSDLADLASEKMKEINEAYDQIQKERAARSSTRGGTASGPAGEHTAYTTAAATLARVRTLINTSRFSEASILLDSVPTGERGAEWNYLRGCTLLQRGWYHDAQKYFEIACYMDPGNTEYQAALHNIRGAADQWGKPYNTASGCSACSICPGLICADCLCDCCGGDLLRCC
ncbi:MAG: J domain-containing protein [Clostridia bacterium]|nr:J domain-containing protein [Clostridia bacterium]